MISGDIAPGAAGDFSRFNNNPFDGQPLFYEDSAPILSSAVARKVIRSAAYHQLSEVVLS
ncbi:protein of unknown function [Paraburkholderia dioscoreae]|uniref:Uncharacterized protein n=1 Tax=Paraburkholderia dioscoreae TaxID=2604047 RepID=A0A5Q4Z3D1_9BURK|nr:protein of unknown function [Paraburkholderia dioscoreae]